MTATTSRDSDAIATHLLSKDVRTSRFSRNPFRFVASGRVSETSDSIFRVEKDHCANLAFTIPSLDELYVKFVKIIASR